MDKVRYRLGLAEQIKGKLIYVKAAVKPSRMARPNRIYLDQRMPDAGAEVGGMLPPDIQKFTNFVIGVRDKDTKPAKAVVNFLTTPVAAAVIKLKGLEPI